MRETRLVITPECRSRFWLLANLRWCAAWLCLRVAFAAIDLAWLISTNLEIEVQRKVVPD